jgi:replication factor A2
MALTNFQITFVGQIRNISTQTTNITYKVDDGTGIIEVKQWIDGDTNQDSMDVDSKAKLAEDSYCRVWGRLKAFNNKRHVGAHVIRPITDYNEINYHLLEATAIHLFFSRGPPSANQAPGGKGVATNGAGIGQEEYTAGGTRLPNMTPIARKVYNAMKESTHSNEGLHCQMIASVLGLSVNDVYKGAEELLGHGVIFTTVDDNTWAILDM